MSNKLYLAVSILLTVLAASTAVYFQQSGKMPITVLLIFLAIGLFVHTVTFISKIFRDIDDFAEAVHYRDFSKQYPENKKRRNNFYRHFNDISRTFLFLSREKEAQHHYLKKMLELVDTGILSYEIETGETLWMNDSLKNMFHIPYLKNIGWLKKRNETLYYELTGIPLGESRLVTINSGSQTIKTLTNACTFQTEGKTYKLVAFHNISATLEEVEAGAWKGLLNVMTHEIMNSIAPVASLADTLKKRMENIKEEMGSEIHPDFEDIEFAMETIRRRSEGLLKFADTYRSLSKTIIPQLSNINLQEITHDIFQLMQPSLQQKGILLETKTDNPWVTAEIDRNLIEQVLINFITNAMHAVREKEGAQIILFSGITAEGESYITVADNGSGIPADIRDKIFIPFFSTKKQGSGIGLSLSREIIKLHKGHLRIQSQEGEGSAFTILFSNTSTP